MNKINSSLKNIEDNTIDVCISHNPPRDTPLWPDVFRIVKPGGYNIVISDNKFYRIVSSLEDCGWEIRDTIQVINSNSSSMVSLAMKPLEGTYVQNANKWNIAGLNIDASRISTCENISNHSRSITSSKSKGIYGDSSQQKTHQTEGQKLGRFPANLIFMHHPDCKKDGIKIVKNKSGSVSGNEPSYTGDDNAHCYGVYKRTSWSKYGDETGEEVVANWKCHNNCPVYQLDRQNSKTKSPKQTKNCGKFNITPGANGTMGGGWYGERVIQGYGDNGGISRYFLQLQTEKDLISYLIQLLSTPFATKIFDPFQSND